MLFKKIRPVANLNDLTQCGTDLAASSDIQHVLEDCHFNEGDMEILKGSYQFVREWKEEILQLMDNCAVGKNTSGSFSKAKGEKYIEYLFTGERVEGYREAMEKYYGEIRDLDVSLGNMVNMLSDIEFYLTTHLLAKQGLQPSKAYESLLAIHKAFKVEQYILVRTFTKTRTDENANSIVNLIDKNAEIMQIRELLANLDRQNVDVQNITASVEEMTSSIEEVATNTTDVAASTQNGADMAIQGRDVISAALQDILRTDQSFNEIVNSFEQLKNSVGTIRKVVGLINGIADQTNLLALNASIEAARAGEEGRGFSVVADEVRKLAENTVSSLKEVNKNMEDLTNISESVSVAINETSTVINKSVTDAQEVLPILDKIVESSQSVSEAMTNVAGTTEEQTSSMEDTSSRMENIASLTEDIRGLGNETGFSVFELSKMIDRFKNEMFPDRSILTDVAKLTLSKADHIMWKWKIYNMILGYEKVKPEDVGNHHGCHLGQWYDDPATKASFGHYEEYKLINKDHEMVHECARQSATAYAAGDMDGAVRCLEQLDEASQKVVFYLEKLIQESERLER